MLLRPIFWLSSIFATLVAARGALQADTAVSPNVSPKCTGIKTYDKGELDVGDDTTVKYIVANACIEEGDTPDVRPPVYLYILISVHSPIGSGRDDKNVYIREKRAPAGSFDLSLGLGTHLYLVFDTSLDCSKKTDLQVKFFIHAT